jgi:hypothetical protein
MSSNLIFDHAILVVNDLPVAMSQFTQLGFTVRPGGVHSGGLTHNALIAFADGAYLELLATTRRSTATLLKVLHFTRMLRFYAPGKTPIGKRLLTDIASGVGLSDFALLSQDLDQHLSAIQERGLTLDGPQPGGRQRPDGQQVSWRTAVPLAVDLPFLIDDVTPRPTRVPGGDAQRHTNAVSGVAGIMVAVPDLGKSAARYRALLGVDPQEPSQFSLPGARSIDFSLGRTTLSLVEPARGNAYMRKPLAKRHSCPLVIWLQTISPDGSNLLALTHVPGRGITLSRSNPFS